MTHHHPQNAINSTIQGVLLFDKESGPTSSQVLARIKKSMGAHRAGHIGTLDPLASGLLPLVFGDATRYIFGWERADKTYTATLIFGATSTTDDAQGALSAMPPPRDWTLDRVHQALSAMEGDIEQKPPLYSAVRVDGKKLYSVARHHETTNTPIPLRYTDTAPRKVRIYSAQCTAFNVEHYTADIRVHCSSGTYIRAIARDLGFAFGSGAYISALRRVGFGPFTEDNAINTEQWSAAIKNGGWQEILMSGETMVEAWPRLTLDDEARYRLSCGQILDLTAPQWASINPPPPKSDRDLRYRLYHNHTFIGMGEITDKRLHAQRLQAMINPPAKPAQWLVPPNGEISVNH